jgi:hypothetical protein
MPHAWSGLELEPAVGFEPLDLPIASRMLDVDLDGSRRIWPAQVECLVAPDGSRWLQNDRLDDQRNDQVPSDRMSDGKTSNGAGTAAGA